MDLFAGCGGMSLGFKAVGFCLSAAVEVDEIAARSHAKNFFGNAPDDTRKKHEIALDITSTTPSQLAAIHNWPSEAMAVDVMIGGPPCQSFARVGRAKLREIAEHPEAFMQDERASLYLKYLEYVDAFEPLVVVLENVPDVMNFGGQNIAQEICEVLSMKGYVVGYTLLNSVMYGVPQMRERMFLIAYAQELQAPVVFPKPTHRYQTPRGYEGSRQVALKNIRDFPHSRFGYVAPPRADDNLPSAVTAREALSDLPKITKHLKGQLKRGARRFTDLVGYPSLSDITPYAQMMRNWPGYESPIGISDHVIRLLPRDYAIFRRMEPGDQYPEAHRAALVLLEEKVTKISGREASEVAKSKIREELYAEFVPPYDVAKFPNKWRKMEDDAPARTLMAHLGKDTYSHIHYDSAQARTISVREAARLQSFPDGFVFCGTMNPAFKQIGNAVPPLLAKAIAAEVWRALPGRSKMPFEV